MNETVQIPDVKLSPERFNTQNLQEELQKSMQQIMQATEKKLLQTVWTTSKACGGDSISAASERRI